MALRNVNELNDRYLYLAHEQRAVDLRQQRITRNLLALNLIDQLTLFTPEEQLAQVIAFPQRQELGDNVA